MKRFLLFVLVACFAVGCASAASRPEATPPAPAVLTPEVATVERSDFFVRIHCGLEDYSLGFSQRKDVVLTGILRADGDDIFVITAAHYKEPGGKWVWGNGYRRKPWGNYKLTPIGLDRASDTALLDLRELGEKFAEFPPWGDSDALAVGDEVTVIGYTPDLKIHRNRGKVIGFGETTLAGVPVIFHGAQVAPGMSGGPLVNDQGEIVGMTIGHRKADDDGEDEWSISIAIPINRIRDLMPALRAGMEREFAPAPVSATSN